MANFPNFAGTPIDVQKMVSGVWDSYRQSQNDKQRQEYMQQQQLAMKQDAELKQRKFQAEQENDRQSMELYNRVYGGGQASSFGGASSGQQTQQQPATAMPAGDNARVAYDFFVKQGLPPQAAAAKVGNFMAESQLNTGAINRGDGRDGSDSIGIAQWNGPRAQGLRQFAAQNNMDPSDFNTQLQYSWHELNTTERPVLEQLRAAQNIDDATAAATSYERPAGWARENPRGAHSYQQRLANAQQVYGQFGGQQAEQADIPAPNAQEVQFQPPGQQQTFTDPSKGSSVRLAELRALMAHPRMKDGMRATLKLEHDQIIESLKQPDLVKQYLFAKGEGYTGNLAEFKKSGAVSVNVGGEGSDYQKELDKGKAERVKALWKAGDSAPEILNSLDVIERSVRNPNVLTGFGGPALLEAQKGLQTAGRLLGIEYSPDSIKDGEAIAKESRQLVAKMAKAAVGARVTNFEFDQFLKANPGLETSPEGNLKLIGIMRQKVQRDMALAEIADEHDGSHRDLQRKIREYDRDHPLVNPDDGKPLRTDSIIALKEQNDVPSQGQQQTQEQPQVEGRRQQQQAPVRVNSPDHARSLPSGTAIMLPDGTMGRVP